MSIRRGAVAGASAATAWLLAEPVIRKFTRLPYGDARLLGRLVAPHGPWRVLGAGIHVVNGVAFGIAFTALGRGGVRDGVVAAQVENAALWPFFGFLDSRHPDRKSGAWPSLLTDRRIIAHEVIAHAVFGTVLGLLTTPEASGNRPDHRSAPSEHGGAACASR